MFVRVSPQRVDYYWSKWSNEWKYKNTGSKGAPEGEGHAYGYDDSDPWLGYCFVVIRNIPTDDAEKGKPPTFKVVIKSRYLIKACQEVMKDVPSISWNTEPGEVSRFARIYLRTSQSMPPSSIPSCLSRSFPCLNRITEHSCRTSTPHRRTNTSQRRSRS